jgi:hypothetical protein
VKHKEPTNDDPIIMIALNFERVLLFNIIFFPIIDVVKNKKRIVNALAKTDIMLTISAIFSGSEAKEEKNAPNIWNSGAPGGCPI